MRTKSFILYSLFSLLSITAYSQGQISNSFNSETENYQRFFFNPFFYDDFSYRFSPQSILIDQSFGKRISVPINGVLSFKDSVMLDSVKALSNIYLVLGTQKNQAIQLENLQRVGKSTFFYLNYNSIASLGFLKNSSSKNRSFNLKFSHMSKKYNLTGGFLIASNLDASSGGISDSIISSNYSKRDLQQLNVNLQNDFLKKKFYKVELLHDFKLFSTSSGEKSVSLSLQNDYSKYGYLYSGDGFSSFYKNVFFDSLATYDTCGYAWFNSGLGISTKINSWNFAFNAINQNFNLLMLDSNYNFNDWLFNASFFFKKEKFNLFGLCSKNLADNFRRNNQEAKIEFLYQVNHNLINKIKLISSYKIINVPFVYQKQFSNHYYWNNISNTPIKVINYFIDVEIKDNLFFSASTSIFNNRVYLNEDVIPEMSKRQENIWALQLSYIDTIGKFHFVETAVYNNSNSSFFPVIPIQSFTRIGYIFSLFKNNLKGEAGFSGVYNDYWYATSYAPAIDDFYLQSEKKFGGLTVLNLFADFKIKSATVFLKFERINIGWFNENSFIRDGYLAPPRTIRFGFNWSLSN